MPPQRAFVLIIPNATLTLFQAVKVGTLSLIGLPAGGSDRLSLILRMNGTDACVDPAGKIQRTDAPEKRQYIFHNANGNPGYIVTLSKERSPRPATIRDWERFDTFLAQHSNLQYQPTLSDLRGRLVAVNQDTGELIGHLDDRRLRVLEDPKMYEEGHEKDPVYIHIPETRKGTRQEPTALKMFVQTIPSDEQDWITASATVASAAISMTSDLLLSTMTAASSAYITYSTHFPVLTKVDPNTNPAIAFLTSESTRENLSNVYAFTEHVAQFTAEAASVFDKVLGYAVASQLGPVNTPSQPSIAVAKPGSRPNGTNFDPVPLLPVGTARSVVLSLDLLLDTLNHEARRLFDVGTQTVGAVVEHTYGRAAAEASLLVAGTAKNVGLIYVDMQGFGRKALLRRVGKEWVKANIGCRKRKVA